MKPSLAAPGEAAGRAPSPPAARWALAALSLAMLLPSLGTSIANVALPTLARSFDAPFQDVQWVVLAYLLAVTALIVGVGRLGDIAGRRRLLLAGLALFAFASLLCGAAPTLPALIAARAAQGLGAAMLMALSMALVGEAVPKERTGSAMGLLGTMSAIGTALGPSLGGVLIAVYGWRAIFLVNLPLAAAALPLAWRYLPADRATPAPATATATAAAGFDCAGTLLLALTLAAYALAMTLGRGDFGAVNLGLLLAAAAGILLFLRVEARAASPLIRPAALRDARLRAGLAMNALVATVMMATLVVGPFYLALSLGLDAARVGLVMAIGPVLSALSGVPAGRLVDRWSAPVATIAGLAAMAAGALALALLPSLLGVAGYVVAIAALTPGYQLFQAANNTAQMRDVPADRRGLVSGLLNLARNLGLITGASAMGAVFALGAATADIATAAPDAVAQGLRVAFVVATALVLAALALAIAGRDGARPAAG